MDSKLKIYSMLVVYQPEYWILTDITRFELQAKQQDN